MTVKPRQLAPGPAPEPTPESTPGPTPRPKTRAQRATEVTTRLTWSFGFWLIIGAIAYGDWLATRGGEDGTARFAVRSLTTFHALMLMAARPPAKDVWPDRIAGYTNAAFLGLSVAACYAIFTSGWENGYRRLWISLGGSYLGMAVEGATGSYGRSYLGVGRTDGNQ